MKKHARYHAYISYSHLDVRFATWLQSALETWRVPRALAAELGFDRIKPVFRDRSDLHAASNLGDSLRKALDQSDALIVVCSRNSAQSRWVGEEIQYFRQQHGDSRIFSIIAADAPPECFPDALLRDISNNELEPIAADSRRGFDGRKNALLKTIAALLEVDFDRLKHRDLRRRYQRMTIVASGSLTMAMVTLTLAIVAYDARDDANRGREQAEGLISFMLGDLRSRLEPIGRLAVLDEVGDRALEYYASLEDEEFTTETLLGRAKALRQIGEVRMSQGDLDEALAAFQLSNDQARRLLDDNKTPELVEFEVGQSHFWIGYVHYERNEIDQAREQFESYLRLSQALLTSNLENTVYQREVAYAYANLGALALKEDRFVDAESYYRRKASINEAMIAASPDDLGLKGDLAETFSWLGEIASRFGDLNSSVSLFRQEYEVRTVIVSSSDDMFQVEQLANAALLLGYSELLVGQLDSATEHFEEARKIGRQLVQHDQDNSWWQQLYAVTGVDLSQVAAAKGDLSAALEHIDAAVAEIRVLADTAAFQTVNRNGFILRALAQRARVLRQLDDVRTHEFIKEVLATVSETDVTDDSEVAVMVAGLRLLDGDLYAEAGDQTDARIAWSEGLRLLDLIPENLREPVALLTRTALLDRSNKPAQAAELRTEIAQLGFRDSEDRALTHALIGVSK